VRYLWALLLMMPWPAAGEIRDVLPSERISALFAGAGASQVVHQRPNFAIVFRVARGAGPATRRADADEVWLVHGGSAALTLNGKAYRISAGDLVYVPRGVPSRVEAGAGPLEMIVVRVFPEGGAQPPALGGILAPRRMPDVVTREQIRETLATHDRNQPLHAGRNFTMNYVIYPAHAGPWEAHRGCVDIYFLQIGTAAAQLGGEISNPKEDPPGEIRGSGVTGARSYRIGPGDLVLIPRNTAHHMDPGPGKLGYLLLKIWAE